MRAFSTVWIGLVAAAALSSAGCLRKEVTQTIYIAPAGVTWTVLERDVRSDEEDPAARFAEEHDYLLALQAGRHSAADALRRLGGMAVTTTWLRRERPYSVMTDARFSDPRALSIAILRGTNLGGEATLSREGGRSTLTVTLDLDVADFDGEKGVEALMSDLDDYRIVLTQGRFVAASGFTIEADGAVAVPDASATPDHGTLTLRLVWDDAGDMAGRPTVSAPRPSS